jgi:hypothetical protein
MYYSVPAETICWPATSSMQRGLHLPCAHQRFQRPPVSCMSLPCRCS